MSEYTVKEASAIHNEQHEDRRMFHRFNVDMGMEFQYLELTIEGKAALRDISANGMGLYTNKQLILHAPVALRITLPPSNESFHFTGEIVWLQRLDNRTYRAGVEFDRPTLIGVWKVLNEYHARQNDPVAATRKSPIKTFIGHLTAFVTLLLCKLYN